MTDKCRHKMSFMTGKKSQKLARKLANCFNTIKCYTRRSHQRVANTNDSLSICTVMCGEKCAKTSNFLFVLLQKCFEIPSWNTTPRSLSILMIEKEVRIQANGIAKKPSTQGAFIVWSCGQAFKVFIVYASTNSSDTSLHEHNNFCTFATFLSLFLSTSQN